MMVKQDFFPQLPILMSMHAANVYTLSTPNKLLMCIKLRLNFVSFHFKYNIMQPNKYTSVTVYTNLNKIDET